MFYCSIGVTFPSVQAKESFRQLISCILHFRTEQRTSCAMEKEASYVFAPVLGVAQSLT